MRRSASEDLPGNRGLERIRRDLERLLSEIGDRLESGSDAVIVEAETLARAGLVYLRAGQGEAAEDCLQQGLELFRNRKNGRPGGGRSTAAVNKQRVIEHRLSFLRALKTYNPPMLKDLYAISSMGLQETREVAGIDRWMDAYNIRADWMREAAKKMLERLRLNSSPEHKQNPRLSFEAEWEPLFTYDCRGYDPTFETRKTAEKRIKALFDVALESHLDGRETSTNAKRERSRGKRPPDVRFKWLAISLTPNESFRSIANREGVDLSNVARGISRARKELGFRPHVRRGGRPPLER